MDTIAGKRLNELTASEIAAATTSGRVTCEAVAQAHLERIAERDPAVFAWYHHDPEHVLKQARALDRGPKQGALYGVPFGIKPMRAGGRGRLRARDDAGGAPGGRLRARRTEIATDRNARVAGSLP